MSSPWQMEQLQLSYTAAAEQTVSSIKSPGATLAKSRWRLAGCGDNSCPPGPIQW